MVAGTKNNDSFIGVCDVFDYHLDIYAVYFIFPPPIFICMQLMCAQCCTPQKAFSIKYHAPCLHISHIHIESFPLSKLQTHSRPEMRFPSQTFLQTSATPSVFCTPTTMTASCPANITTVWKTSVQMTAFKPPWDKKAPKALKGYICESRSIQLLLKNKDPTKKYLWVFFAGFLSVLASYFYRVAKAVLTEEQVIPIRLSSIKSLSIYSKPL